MSLTPFPKDQFLDSSNLKQFADDNFKFDENDKFLELVGSTVGKGEIALYMSNFSFYHSVFKRLALQTRKNQGLYGKGLKMEFIFFK